MEEKHAANIGLGVSAQRTQQIQNQDHNQDRSDNAAAPNSAKAAIAESAAGQEQHQKDDEKKRHQEPPINRLSVPRSRTYTI